MKKLRVLAATSVLGLALTGCGGGSGSETTTGDSEELQTVTVGHVQLTIFSPLYVADAKGYFEDAGIDIEFENIKSGQAAVPLAANGDLDVVAAGFSAGMFSAIETGLDISVVGSMGVQPGQDQPSPSALVVSEEQSASFESLKDLKDLDIGALGGTGGTSAYYISLALAEAGLTINDVNLVNLGNPDMPSALENGSIDAAFISAPFWQLAVDGGSENVWTTPKGTSGTGVLYGGEFADSDLAQPFFDAMAKGAQDLQGEERYSDENLKIIGEYTEQSPEDVASVPLYTWHPDLHPLPEQLSGMEDVWMNIGALDYSDQVGS